MSILFLRRKGLGLGSVLGMKSYLTSSGDSITANVYTTNHRKWRDQPESSTRLMVRWGVTTPMSTLPGLENINTGSMKVYNKAEAISRVNNKSQFRQVLLSEGMTSGLVPPTTFLANGLNPAILSDDYPVIVRPNRHAQGRNLWVANNGAELTSILRRHGRNKLAQGGYISKLIPKQKEYRVYVFDGRVASVAEKIPHDRNQVAWNVAQGGEFRVVRWDEWPLEAIRASVECFRLSGLNFGGVDVILSDQNIPYVIEINSAPSLPSLSDGSISYRQSAMAKCFAYAYNKIVAGETTTWMEPSGYDNWRNVIHPALNHNAILNQMEEAA